MYIERFYNNCPKNIQSQHRSFTLLYQNIHDTFVRAFLVNEQDQFSKQLRLEHVGTTAPQKKYILPYLCISKPSMTSVFLVQSMW